MSDPRLSNIISLCLESDRGRGIWKRIDENRELLWLIQTEFLKNHYEFILRESKFFWMRTAPFECWLASNDMFFHNIIKILCLEKPASCGNTFPRPWPGRSFAIEECYINYDQLFELKKCCQSARNEDEELVFMLTEFCFECDGARGIWKRIDENREILGAFLRGAPEFLRRFPSVESMMENQDIFFSKIVSALWLEQSTRFYKEERFPRPWPGTIRIERFHQVGP
jgi:hypothetical protein